MGWKELLRITENKMSVLLKLQPNVRPNTTNLCWLQLNLQLPTQPTLVRQQYENPVGCVTQVGRELQLH
jgi:hypothetical protein